MPTNNAKDAIYITKQDAKRFGFKFYVSENPCKNCLSRPSLRYTCNSNCISCNRARYKKGSKQ